LDSSTIGWLNRAILPYLQEWIRISTGEIRIDERAHEVAQCKYVRVGIWLAKGTVDRTAMSNFQLLSVKRDTRGMSNII
jgi:hypothetical protein